MFLRAVVGSARSALRGARRAGAWAVLSLVAACSTRPSSTSAGERTATALPRPFDRLPDRDDGLPGEGPIRRYDWFRALWRERHAAWAARGARDEGAVVFLGDSITQEWGDDLGGSFPGLKVANRGISGDTTRGMLVRLGQDVIALRPRAVVVLAGTNDLEEGAPPESAAANMERIVAALEESRRDLPIVLCEVFPSSPSQKRPAALVEELNRLYADLASRHPSVTLARTWAPFAGADGNADPALLPDRLHPNALGYRTWAQALRPVLAKVLSDAR